jgi:LysR family cys regulon transcriptional activator
VNFQQLRIIRETVRRNFNLTEVAQRLHTSQSGVSKHIKDLEDELGVELYVRRGKRLLGLTEPGKEMARIVERMLLDAHNIRNLADQYSRQDSGELVVATTHTQARYALPPVVAAFRQRYPKVHLKLHQGSPGEIARMLQEGTADIGVATESIGAAADLIAFSWYRWQHALIVPADHPLTAAMPLTLEAIAAHPIITYHEGFTGRAAVEHAFAEAGAEPDIVMSAMDADVIKCYVGLGLGVGVVASLAFDPARDQGLTLLPCDHLFPVNETRLALRRGHLLRRYAYHFLELCAPELTEARVVAAVAGEPLVAEL